ncbi:hypothetical protein SB6419_03881 [Klebsiella spallanzanii]|nr:hypothetical protein SB6419_03881 [Klebsiella spallanzanii]
MTNGLSSFVLLTLHAESRLSKSAIDFFIGKRRKGGPFSGGNQRGTILFVAFTCSDAIQLSKRQ